jgi:N-acetylneuraminate synthase
LSQRFDVVAGYSGHDLGIALSLVARALGAAVIEKHITFDRGASGPDHRFSLLPEELTALVASIRDVDEGLKTGREGEILQGEQLNRFVFKKSVVAKKAIKAGDIIERDALAIRGPGIGLSPHRLNELIGRRAIRDVGNDEMLFDEDLGAPRESYRMSMPCPGWGLVVRYHDFETALPHGPECLEFHLTTADMEMELPFAKLDAYAADLRALVLRVHSPEYIGNRLFDLFSIYPEVYSASLATLQRVIDVTSELGSYFNGESPMIVFNCGAMTLQGEARALPLDVGRFYAGIASLNLKGTRLLAQNMPPFPWYFGGQWHGHYFLRASELMEFCEQTGGGICLDISHAYMATRFLKVPLKKYIQELLPYVHHIHVSDARSLSGEGVQIGEGEVDFKEIGPLIFERPLRRLATWVPEIWQGHVNCNSGALAAIAALGKLGIWG